MTTAKPSADQRWYVFAVPELPIRYGHEYAVAVVANSRTCAVVDATEVSCTTSALVVGILHPDGDIGRVGHGNYLAMLPPSLRGRLVRHNDGDFVVVLPPDAG